MGDTQHTPGPWIGRCQGGPHNQGLIYSEATGDNVAVAYNHNGTGDTALLASAPDLLAALKLAQTELAAIWDYESQNQVDPDEYNATEAALAACDAAIAKATGAGAMDSKLRQTAENMNRDFPQTIEDLRAWAEMYRKNIKQPGITPHGVRCFTGYLDLAEARIALLREGGGNG
jgi:hypothetical protein